MKLTLPTFFFLLLTHNPCWAFVTCPPAHLVERSIDSPSSKIKYQGLWYHVGKTLFSHVPYQLSKVAFIEAEMNTQKIITCAYEAFGSGDMKWGDVLLTAYHPLMMPHAPSWFLHEEVMVCINKQEELCSFKLEK